jgi:Ni/Co efflux regulator RcnB
MMIWYQSFTTDSERVQERERERDRERKRERKGERQREKERKREREKERKREQGFCSLAWFEVVSESFVKAKRFIRSVKLRRSK